MLLLLVVGSADRRYIDLHEDHSGFSADDFDLLAVAISEIRGYAVVSFAELR